MARTLRTYQVTVLDGGKHTRFTTQQRNGAAAFHVQKFKLGHLVHAQAGPLHTHRAG